MTADLTVYYPACREPERNFIFDVVLRHFLGLEFVAERHASPNVRIVCGTSNQELTIDDGLFATPNEHWLMAPSLPKRPVWHAAVAQDLRDIHPIVPASVPVLYGTEAGAMFSRTQRGARIGFDLFGSIFFMITRYEEIVTRQRDRIDRFPAAAALAVQEGFIERAVVNEWVEILWAALHLLWPALIRRQRTYSVVLSHDVDEVSLLGRPSYLVFRTIGADLILRREIRTACKKAKAWLYSLRTGRIADGDPYNSFDFLMDVSEAHGLKSAFYFIPDRSHPYDGRYTLDDPWIRGLMRRMHQRGHELGYHASYNTYRDAARTSSECDYLRRICDEEHLDQQIRGGRQHYLRWTNPQTWSNWESSKLEYDSTLTFAEQPGFRTGCCYEYPVMNLLTRERLNLLERPLVAMENSLLTYNRLSLRQTAEKLMNLAGVCRRYSGAFTLLWHNSSLASQAAKSTYVSLIDAVV